MKKKNPGFSLIELLIAISILSIMGSAILWGISGVKQKNMEKYARSLCGQIQLLRTTAMSKGGQWRLALYEEAGSYYCVMERFLSEEDGEAAQDAGLIEGGWSEAAERSKLGSKGAVNYILQENMDGAGDSNQEPTGAGAAAPPLFVWRFNRDTGACICGAGTFLVKGAGRPVRLTVYPENGTCEVKKAVEDR